MLKNYPENVIMKQFEKAKVKDRKSLIYRQRPEKKKKVDGKVRLIFTHNASNPPVHKWLRESQKLLVEMIKQKPLEKRCR